ncbi:alpha/beta hydrolase [Agromyces sp. LHK192]|uniref:RBBP9/YdeN family alpha/beta hydrolase n=1 Tax=Agromyces sp. LHK192 TaxID=2498704 RepID=UPI000FD97529|nr:alpha/beta hydrolase [Agromyces sp. LHK192]
MNGVVVPGIDGSGPEHWQTLWEASDPGLVRFAPASWTAPDRDDWRRALRAAIVAAGPDAIVIAHSLGCLAAVDVLTAPDAPPCAGVFLVAVPDVDGPRYPDAAASFRPVRPTPIGVPAVVVASTDDEFGPFAAVAGFAADLEARLVVAGAHGHLNALSGIGHWPEGRALLEDFAAELRSAV